MLLLYPGTETAFEDNGIGALSDAISCTVTEARNGEYELSLEYPITGIHYNEIKNRCIITAKPNPYADPQPFRIYRITKPLSGRVTVYAQHISYDLSGVTVAPFSAGSAVGALVQIPQNATSNNAFAFWTDVQDTGTMTVAVPSSVRSILGGQEGSILDVYGGEYEWDGYTVRLWSRRGRDSGVTIRYGKNLTSLEQDENIANVATGVYPYWTGGEDGALVTLPEKTVNAPGTYDFEHYIPLDLSGDFDEQPSVPELRARAQQYVKDNNIGIPTVSITVAFQPLDQTEEYKDIALLERVNLCDTVTVEYPALGVSATAKCVKTVYDALKDKYISIDLGDARTNLADTIVQQQQEIEKVPTTSAMQQAIENANKWIANGQIGEMIAIKRDGKWVEIASLDTGDINTAQSVWRWNNGGFGHSANGYNGDYTLALTRDGAINASLITTGILNASLIKTGRIVGKSNPNVYFDLDSGEISASALISPAGDYRADIGVTTVGDRTDSGVRIKAISSDHAAWYTPSGISSTTSGAFRIFADNASDFDISAGGDSISMGRSWFTYANASQPVIRVTPDQLQIYQPDSPLDFIQIEGSILSIYLGGKRVLASDGNTTSISGTLSVVGSLLVNGYPIEP